MTTLATILVGANLLLVGAAPRRPSPPSTTAKVVTYIHEVSPQTPWQRVVALGRDIVFAAQHWGVDPLLLAAIVRQESTFLPEQRVCYGVVWHRACAQTCDLGVTQVNTVWVRKWGLDADRLVVDDTYALWVGARVLAVLQREYGDDEPEDWYSRYNSANDGPRKRYEQALQPFLAVKEAVLEGQQ